MFDDGAECGKSPSLSMRSISEEEEDDVNFIVKNDTSDGDRLDNILVKIQPKMTSIVVNGKDVNTNERYPWLVALRTASGHHFCGGALISDSWILTAAHCQFSTYHDVVVAKTTFRDFPHPDETIIRGVKVVDHPEASVTAFGTWDFDFELVKLANKIRFDGKLSPICLPPADEQFAGEKCWLAGWGRIQATPKKYAEKLQEVKTRVNYYCGHYESLVSKASFCAGFNGASSGCSGDSGSPLVCPGRNGFVVAGVASWASMDCAPGAPTGFAKVAHVRDWILSVMDK